MARRPLIGQDQHHYVGLIFLMIAGGAFYTAWDELSDGLKSPLDAILDGSAGVRLFSGTAEPWPGVAPVRAPASGRLGLAYQTTLVQGVAPRRSPPYVVFERIEAPPFGLRAGDRLYQVVGPASWLAVEPRVDTAVRTAGMPAWTVGLPLKNAPRAGGGRDSFATTEWVVAPGSQVTIVGTEYSVAGQPTIGRGAEYLAIYLQPRHEWVSGMQTVYGTNHGWAKLAGLVPVLLLGGWMLVFGVVFLLSWRFGGDER